MRPPPPYLLMLVKACTAAADSILPLQVTFSACFDCEPCLTGKSPKRETREKGNICKVYGDLTVEPPKCEKKGSFISTVIVTLIMTPSRQRLTSNGTA